VFSPGVDQPIVVYDASGNRSFLGSDERGSVISSTDSAGTLLGINAYDEYGRPGASNTGRFQYTGQRWLGEAGLYDYKARNYLPRLGIFGQADPIGQSDSANLYAYVVNDPVNLIDPLGLAWPDNPCPFINGGIVCTAGSGGALNGSGAGGGGAGGNPSRLFPKLAKFIARSEDRFTCADALNEAGTIEVRALSGGVVGAIGWTGAAGTWRNLRTGSHGRFRTFGFAAGLSGGASGGVQRWSSLSSFAGPSDSFTFAIAFNFGPFSIGGEYNYGWNDTGSGQGGGVSVSSSGLPRVAVQSTSTETELTQCLPGPTRR
jgi:RHS repeat-associated protein